MAYSKILFFSIIVRFLTFATIMAQDSSFFLNKFCSPDLTNSNSNTEFYNPIIGTNPSDSIYGMFMCRGDVDSQLCHECIGNATQHLSSECSLSKQASIWYNECTVRYSNDSFFSVVDMMPGFYMCNTANFSNTKSFTPLLFSTMNLTADEAASDKKKFATNERVFEFQTLYCLAQCTSDLSSKVCGTCLRSAIKQLQIHCDGKLGGRFLYPSCNVRYELYPFYRSINVPSPNELAPQTKDSISKQDSRFLEDPFYLSYNCSSNHNTITSKNFNLLLSYLVSNATAGKLYHRVIMDEIVYGLFMCRGDLPSRLCVQCVTNAKDRIFSMCLSSSEGIIWYSHCLLRYSSQYFFPNIAETSPMYRDINITNHFISDQNLFTSTLSNQLSELANATGNSDERYMINSLKLNDIQTLYTLEQCTPYLSPQECISCLNDMISTQIPWSFLGSVGGRIIYPNCNMRFELFQFYIESDEARSSRNPSKEAGELFAQIGFILFYFIFIIFSCW
ncbi:putative cysteine-rich receptor-like protein kinase 23 [Trifolium pratense]|uniref:putative cysteine-rich receptor-like protein kinase 23 n=1 Tax=Trifolium pratense TaxID=57577 RepID=UPI001E69005D|nr:putative cysteine-rich receptor-like protein kinase 23 [Trifolium pratense]